MKRTFGAYFRSIAGVVVASLILGGCFTKGKTDRQSVVTVAVEGDVDSFNPLFAEEVVAGEINDLIFPRLINPEFDSLSGRLTFEPWLATSWEFANENRDLTFHLRGDAYWSDSVRVTARDVQLSMDLYGDPQVASVRQTAVQRLKTTNGRFDASLAVEVVNDTTVVFHFERANEHALFDVGVPIIPAHVFAKIPRKEIRNHLIGRKPVTSGPYSLLRWTPLQEVVLVRNEHFLADYIPKHAKLVFKVIPDYRSRVAQLQSGDVDVVSGLRVEDAQLLGRKPAINVFSVTGRDYDFLGWNNIDPAAYSKSGGKLIRPNVLFGSAQVRRALTMAINRSEIVNAYLGQYGQEAIGGVSPLFRWAFNDTIQPLPHDVQKAAALLQAEGWRDTDGDGILDKNGTPFSFTLKLASGNELRAVIAAAVKQQLRAVKIQMKIEQVERGTFWNDLIARKYDAWFAGLSVPLEMQLDDLWGSDLKKYPFNLVGYQNRRVDEILEASKKVNEDSAGGLWKELQLTIHRDQPYTFLFWINNIVAVNSRVKVAKIDVLGTTHGAWDWRVDQSGR